MDDQKPHTTDHLVDTHTFLWFTTNSPLLSPTADAIIRNPNNVIYLSIASVWEMSIKVSIGKLTLAQPIVPFVSDQVRRNRFRLLPIDLRHMAHVSSLPLHHRDPFDRLLVAQSRQDNLPLISVDDVLDAYGIIRIW
jgi:PIN domain nuclease of toxin-antitoxin system